MSRFVQRHHGKDCLCLANGVAALRALVLKDPIPGTATYMGIWGDADWPCHVWDLEPVLFVPDVGPDDRLTPAERKALTDEELAEIMRTVHRVYAGPAAPLPYNPAIFRRPAAPEPQPYPEPIVSSRDDQAPDSKPGPVRDLATLAESLGWEVVAITYAEGWLPHATRATPGAKPKVSWAVRMRRGDRRAVAVRMDDAWSSLWMISLNGMASFTTLGAFQEALV